MEREEEINSDKKIPKKKTASLNTNKKDQTLEKMLIENFISMQKVMTNLAEKFDDLTKKLSNLLELFEESAKTLSQKEVNLELKGENQEEVLEKLKLVLEQNKIIAKGLTLMHEATIGQYNQPKELPVQRPIPSMSMSQLPQKQPMMEQSSINQEMPSMKTKVLEEKEPDFSIPQNA